MGSAHFKKAALLAVFVLACLLGAWEVFLRSRNIGIAYDDGKELWAHKRGEVYQPANKATVFIGSSRIKYDLDVDTWRRLSGEDAVLLACEGTSPLPALDDLAADEKFKGKLVIDVTEGLFFADVTTRRNDIFGFIQHFKKQTPAEKASFVLNRPLESSLVLLDRDNLSLNAFLDRLQLKNRTGVFVMPLFPLEFGRVNIDRQNKMADRFLLDTNLQNQVKANWAFFRSQNKTPPVTGAKLDSFFKVIKLRVDQIRARGGQVLFVRTPSSGPFWMGEQKAYPRSKYWDRLLQHTQTPGIHFADYEPIAHLQCPEFSHLSPQDAVVFTTHFFSYVQAKGWQFGNNRSTASIQN